jgi:hypothetical protein
MKREIKPSKASLAARNRFLENFGSIAEAHLSQPLKLDAKTVEGLLDRIYGKPKKSNCEHCSRESMLNL